MIKCKINISWTKKKTSLCTRIYICMLRLS